MPVTYPLSLTGLRNPRSVVIRKRSAVGVNASPFTFQPQVYAWSGQMWEADITLAPMQRALAEAWVAALVSLNGREGNFLIGPDYANTSPRGIGTGTPLVMGASQTGYDLITDGWTAGQTGIMKAGDWFSLGTTSAARLYKVMVDANSNGSGVATLTIWPKLRSSPADNAALTVTSPKGRFMLASNETEWSIDTAAFYGLSFRAVEDLRP
jgi:hypothetical protein